MKILHVADHSGRDNDDEGSIGYALEQLGHSVTRIAEEDSLPDHGFDFCLFHKGTDLDRLASLKIPCVFWYFDLICNLHYEDLAARYGARQAWVRRATELCLCGFCTDGDWVASDTSGKLHHLLQGCDERIATQVQFTNSRPHIDILFTGTPITPLLRLKHIEYLRKIYGTRLTTIGHRVKHRIHGAKLSRYLLWSKIALAPIAPVTNWYWSNRVYLTTSLGGFMVHPRCCKLMSHFQEGNEIAYYDTMKESSDVIRYYLEHDEEREQIRRRGYERCLREHTYRHRCEELIRKIKERL